jgi:hypothetical protein
MTEVKPLTFAQRIERMTLICWRKSLLQRMVDGDTLEAGDTRIYLNDVSGDVEEREITVEDLEVVTPAYQRYCLSKIRTIRPDDRG